MQIAPLPQLTARPMWLSEHYWPDLGQGLVLTQVQRAALVQPPVRWLATLVLPGQQTALTLLSGPDPDEVTRALTVAGVHPDRVSAALQVLADSTDAHSERTPR